MSARRNIDIAATNIDRPVTLTISTRHANYSLQKIVLQIAFPIAVQALVCTFVPLRAAGSANRLASGVSRLAFLQFRRNAGLVRSGFC